MFMLHENPIFNAFFKFSPNYSTPKKASLVNISSITILICILKHKFKMQNYNWVPNNYSTRKLNINSVKILQSVELAACLGTKQRSSVGVSSDFTLTLYKWNTFFLYFTSVKNLFAKAVYFYATSVNVIPLIQ